MPATMTDDQIEDFCVSHLEGQVVEEFTASWEYPGCLCLSVEGLGEVSVLASPDLLNGEPNRLTFGVEYKGELLLLADEDSFSWDPETAVARWRAALEQRLAPLREVLNVIWAEGEEGFARLCRGPAPFMGAASV